MLKRNVVANWRKGCGMKTSAMIERLLDDGNNMIEVFHDGERWYVNLHYISLGSRKEWDQRVLIDHDDGKTLLKAIKRLYKGVYG